MGLFQGKVLADYRKRRGFTSQQSLADELNRRRNEVWEGEGEAPEITQQLISWWETGRNQPTPENAVLLARVLDVSMDFLYGVTHDPQERLIPTVPVNSLLERLIWAVNKKNTPIMLETLAALTKGEEDGGVSG